MTSDFAESSAAKPPAFARPRPGFYAFIGIMALIGVAMMIFLWVTPPAANQPDPQSTWMIFVGITFLLPCAVSLWLMRRLCVVADARGLWIRRIFKQSFVSWRELEDYELRPAPQSADFRLRWVRYQGQWHRLPQGFASMDALQARIQAEAKWSRARDWQLNIEREADGEWPKTYAYLDPSGRKTFGFVIVGCLFVCGFSYWPVFSPQSLATTRLIWDDLELWGRIGSLLMPLIVLLLFALFLWPHYAIFRAKGQLGHQIIRADRDGLTLLDSEIQARVPWPEITDYFIEDAGGPINLPQFVVESAEARVVFRQEIENSGELRALIRARATNAKSDDWRARESADSDTLGGETTLWLSGET